MTKLLLNKPYGAFPPGCAQTLVQLCKRLAVSVCKAVGVGHLCHMSVICAGEHIILIEGEHLALILQRLREEKHMRARVKGILVGSGTADAPKMSPADRFPLAAYAPYKASSHPWNINGTGISNLDIDIPIFHLEDGLTASVHRSTLLNREQVG